MNPVRPSADRPPGKQASAIELSSSSNRGGKEQFQQISDLVRYGKFRQKPNFLSLTLWGVGALCVPLLIHASAAAESNSDAAPASTQDKTNTSNSTPQAASVSPSELESLRDEVRQLREELKSLYVRVLNGKWPVRWPQDDRPLWRVPQ
jgi:hypothetical protein